MPQPQTEVSILLSGEQIYRRLLSAGEYIIGSADDAEIRFPSDQLAPRHARLIIGARDNIVQDLGSALGTFVNGERVRNVRVVPETHRIEIAGSSIALRRISEGTTTIGDSAICGPTISLVRVSGNGGEPAAASEPLSFPQRKYDIGRLVATGGMGAILDAFETASERHVAMKIMADSARKDFRRFLLEARITAQLEHPNIVPLHELAINEEGRPYYTMKLVQGVSLRRVFELLSLQDPGAIQSYSLDALLTIFQKVCDAVAFAHSKGVLHRDLKPDNIMLGQYGEALVMDWGLAKLIGVPDLPPADGQSAVSSSDSHGSSDKTLEGEVLGTPNYMSPEQARGEIERLDPRTDIYSLGAILYHYLTLEPPVGGKTVHEVLANACIGRIVSPIKSLGRKKLRHLPAGRVPESLDAVVMKALAHEPDDRYRSVTDLQQEIRAYQTGFATAAERAGAWRLFKLFFIRHLAVSIAVSLLLISGAIFLGYMIYEKNEADTQRDTAETRLYLSHMAQVRNDIENGRPQSAHELLALHEREPTGKDLRGWEWYYALGQLNDDGLRINNAHSNGAFTLTASPDGSLLASGGADGDIAIWKTQGLESKLRFHAHDDAVFAAAWSPSGNLLASAGGKGMVRIWNAKTGQKLAEVLSPAGQAVHALSWNCTNPDDPILAFGGPFSDVFLWKPLASGDEAKPKLFHKTKQGVSGLCWSANGAYLALAKANQSGGLDVLGPDGESALAAPITASIGSDLSAVAFDPSNHYIAVGTRHRSVSVIDILTNIRVFSAPLHSGMVNALAWSPDGKQLASVGDDCAVRIVSPFDAAASGRRPTTRILSAYPRPLNAVVWADLPGNSENDSAVSLLAAVDGGGVLREWAANDAQPEFTRKLFDVAISAAHWSPDGKKIAAAGFSYIIDLTDDTGATNIPLETASIGVYDFQWSPKGDRLGIANREGQGLVEVLDVATGKWLDMFSLPNANRVAWKPTGNCLAASSINVVGDKTPARVSIWDLSTDREIGSLQTSATCLVWSRDGRRLYLGGENGSIHVWDGSSKDLGAELRPASPPQLGSIRTTTDAPLQVFDLALSPDGKLLAFVTQDGQAGLIDLQSGKQVCSFAGAASGLRRVAWSPDGRRVATCGTDGILRIYDTKEGGLVAHVVHGTGEGEAEVQGLDWRPDGHRILTGGWDKRLRLWDADRGMQIAEAEDSAKLPLNEAMGSPHLQELARGYAQLKWTDLARKAYGLAAMTNPTSLTLAGEVAAAENSFESALTPSASPDDESAPELLREIHANWREHTEKSLEKYRRLATLPDAAHFLPLAHHYFSNCIWKVKWFPSTVDPVANTEAWRALANTPSAVTVDPSAMLCFPYHRRSPRELGFDQKLTASGLSAENWGMIATTQIDLPAGKWRLQTETNGGVRVRVDDATVFESWTPDSTGVHSVVYDQRQTGPVKFTVEQFVTKPCDSFEFLLIPILDSK